MLYSPPPSRTPLFPILANKAFLESPDQQVSPELYFRSFADTHTKIWRLEKCCTIRPLPGGRCFSF